MLVKALKELKNVLGWKTKRKIIVFEVDDYGSSRVHPFHVDKLIEQGFNLSFFEKYDRIAKESELKQLFDILESVKDSTGRSAVFTPMSIITNPDFKKIKESRYQQYFFKPFYETAKDLYNEDILFLWKKGIKQKIFLPEFHGREHFHVSTWMKALQEQNKSSFEAFNFDSVGLFGQGVLPEITRFGAAFDLGEVNELSDEKRIIESGLKLFEEIFDYKAISFTPPDGFLNKNLESPLADLGIKSISVSRKRVIPLGNKKFKKEYNYQGRYSKDKQIVYTIRNAVFEPHSSVKTDWVDSCLKDITSAFRWKKPAIISSHRINFLHTTPIPYSNLSGLQQLELLLKKIVKTWPDIEFRSSRELTTMMLNKK